MKKSIPFILIILALAVIVLAFPGCKHNASKRCSECEHAQDCGKDYLTPSAGEEHQIDFNDRIVGVLEEYARDGSLPYKWISGYEGVTQDLCYQGDLIANANADSSRSSYCCGLTFEVYYRSIIQAMKDLGMKEDLNGMEAEDFADFISKWFVQEKNGDGPGLALIPYGLGKRIEKMSDVRKGDFVQIWRTSGSGHSVIFIEWTLNEEGDTTGMTYWSTQPGTDGVNYNTEYFDGYGGKVDKAVTHYSRAYAPNDFIER